MKKRETKLIIFIAIISVILLLVPLSTKFYQDYIINNFNKEQTKVNELINNKNTLQTLKEEFNNKDIIAVLKVSNIINIPVTQTKDNKYYLTHGLSKKKVYGGSPFIDFRTPLESKQINIYGHNSSKRNLPFEELEKYLDNNYIKDNDLIELTTENKTYKYKITYLYIEEQKETNEHFKSEYKNETTWNKHLSYMKDKSYYITKDEINTEDNILILQTCLFDENEDKLLIIVAKQIN